MRERKRSLPVKLQQAAMWLPTSSSQMQPPQQELQLQSHRTAAQRLSPSGADEQQKTGYINVCGIDLPCKTLDASSVVAAQAERRLIHTPAVGDNLKAAALALCQSRPLLLEGPPGEMLASCCPMTVLAFQDDSIHYMHFASVATSVYMKDYMKVLVKPLTLSMCVALVSVPGTWRCYCAQQLPHVDFTL